MKIHQIYTHNQLRNFNYIIELENKSAIVIDPWDASDIDQKLEDHGLHLKAIINTHEHWDHTQGNKALVEAHACEVWAHSNGEGKVPGLSRCLEADEMIHLDGDNQLLVLDTPGHTYAHLCFVLLEGDKAKAVFTGDTLFNAGVGRCDGGGDPDALYHTISSQIRHLADEVVVYPGHDYLENNLRFTLEFEPSNLLAKQWLEKVKDVGYRPGLVRSTIRDEKGFNVFLRLEESEIINKLNLEKSDPKAVFLALRGKRDHW
ncbi:MAG: hydroxyacylglutathione hydrolase [Candidatus Azotimanducaceae bacterium]|jgi:hydroxyacylglutathione hydrolase